MKNSAHTLVSVSVVVLARNERENLPRCLAALSFASEVVVVDDGSTDGTQEIARGAGARVLSHPLPTFAGQRNWAMEEGALQNDWVLHLDADEVVTRDLAAEIRDRMAGDLSGVAGFHLARKTMLGEHWLRFSATYPVYVSRLVHRGRFRFEACGHGERVGRTDGRLDYLRQPCLHYNFSKGWAEWVTRHNRYSTDEARRIADGAPVCWRSCLSRDPVTRRSAWRAASYRLPGRPLLRFAYVYLLRGGMLDGRAGFTYCLLQAFYEYLIGLKVRELRRRG